jgi:hypothetical protein
MDHTDSRPELGWIERLAEKLLGNNNDAVKLAYLDGEGAAEQIGQLDLSLLSELKRNANGTVEIKLVDQVKALEELIGLRCQLTGTQSDAAGQAEALYQALERQAVRQT